MHDGNSGKTPRTIEEAVDILMEELDAGALSELASMESADVEGETHVGLGLTIRNRWLWRPDCKLTLDDVPDIVSARIVRSLWERVRKEGLPGKTPGDGRCQAD